MDKFYTMFQTLVIDWFDNLNPEEQITVVVRDFEHILEEDESPRDFITGLDWQQLWEIVMQNGGDYFDSMGLNGSDVISSILQDAAKDLEYQDYDFADDFVDDITYHIIEYSDPKGCFMDLAQGGCISGMVGMFIYHSDCKNYYIEHIDSMEDFKEDLEERMGCAITNIHKQPHYTFMCWLCYEEFAYGLARYLFESDF